MSKIPMKKVGADWPTSASPIAVWSTAELRRTAEMTPMGRAITIASAKAVRPSSSVAGKYPRTTPKAGWRKWIERPKSPRSALPRNTAYCTGSGRSRPSSARTRKISLRGASGGSSSGTGSPDRRMTTNTTVETSQSAMAARSSREPRKGRRPRMRDGAEPERAPPGYAALRAAELEVEAPNLELLQRIRRPLHVLLQAVVLVRLDHGDPGQMLEEDLRHLLVRVTAKLFIDREARGGAELVELGMAPVVLRPARTEQPPHHAIGIAQRRRRIRPPEPLEGLVAVLLSADRILEELDLGVHPDVPPHGLDRLAHGLVACHVSGGGLDDDLFALVAGFLEALFCLGRIEGQGGLGGIEVVVALR